MLWALSIKHLCCIQSTRTLKKSDMGARGTEILPPTIYPTGSLPKGLWNPIWVKPKPESRNSTLVPNMGGKGPSSGTMLCCLAGNWIRSSQNSKQHLKQLQALYSLTHFAPASRLAVVADTCTSNSTCHVCFHQHYFYFKEPELVSCSLNSSVWPTFSQNPSGCFTLKKTNSICCQM